MRKFLVLLLPLALAGAAWMTAYRAQDVRSLQLGESASTDPVGQADCPVTLPPDPPFVPPSPWPATPPSESEFWFGSAGLWTALPRDGSWRQLAIGEKFWWWSENYGAGDVRNDSTPDLEVAATRFDEATASFRSTEATNGFHPSFNQAMLMGVRLPRPGCWQFEAEFGDNRLSFAVWVPGD